MAIAEIPKGAAWTPRVSEVLTEQAGPMQRCVQRACAAFETETTIDRILGSVQEALRGLLAEADPLDGLALDRQDLRSWKVYEDPVHLFCLSVSHQRAGHSRGVHDHGELGWAVYGLLSGSMEQHLYCRTDGGGEAGKATLHPQPVVHQRPGDATIVPVAWAHAPRNPTDQETWTIAIRSRDQDRVWRNRYDVQRGLVFRVGPGGGD